MAIHIYKSLVCDAFKPDRADCTNAFHEPAATTCSHAELRELAHQKGWIQRKIWRGSVLDYCPECRNAYYYAVTH